VPLEGYPDASIADGMAIDIEGNLYVTTQLGVQVLDRDGKYLGTIAVPEQPANCAFGGPDLKTLFITATSGLYGVDLKVPGICFPQK
jgi:gluconolactonase